MGFISPRTAPLPVLQPPTGLPAEDGIVETGAQELSGQQAGRPRLALHLNNLGYLEPGWCNICGGNASPFLLLSSCHSAQAQAEAEEGKSVPGMDGSGGTVTMEGTKVTPVQRKPSPSQVWDDKHLPHFPGWVQMYTTWIIIF